MMRFRLGIVAVLIFCARTVCAQVGAQTASGAAIATGQPGVAMSTTDTLAFINTAFQFATRGNYMGTIVFQRGGQMEAMRLVHVNDNGVERERFTSLDGASKEMVREGDRTATYFPEAKLVRMQAMQDRAFPVMTNAHVQALLTLYTASDLGTERIAGLLARGVAFTPRDGMRYPQQWWVEAKTGLPVRARVMNERGEIIEQASFTDLQLEGRINHHHLRSAHAAKARDWRIEAIPAPGILIVETGWLVRELPVGFTKVREGVRALEGNARVPHLLFSDGVATISVFIEPASAGDPLGLTQRGAMNVYRRHVNENVVTALGQSPPQALKAIADALAKK